MAVETMEFISAVARMIRAAGRRVAEADEPELAALNELRHTIDEALHTAVHGQRAGGRSWSDIAAGTGTTKQTAHERFSKPPSKSAQ